MRVKICGMRNSENVHEVSKLSPDLLGFIFYAGSPRAVVADDLSEILRSVSTGISKVAVFVNEELSVVKRTCQRYDFRYAQLHGAESVDYCANLNEVGISVIKAFGVDANSELSNLDVYKEHVDLFLFDTKTVHHGGSGKHFDWSLLKDYSHTTPYFLSGGISPDDIDLIKRLDLPGLVGIDANSRLETSPGMKDLDKTRTLISQIRDKWNSK